MMTERKSTPRVGRWEPRYWLCECDETPNNIAESERCMFCGTLRPPLPETPAPSEREQDMADYRETQAMSARTTKVALGKEPIAGVDDERSEDELCEDCGTRKAAVHLESASVNELCEPCYIELLERLLKRERERPESSVDAVVKVLRGEFGHLPSVDADVLDYSARRVLAALRAVPVEGDEPVCYQLRQRGQSGHWLRWESYDSESMRDGFLPRDAEYELRTLYAHPAPDEDIRTVLLHFIDTAGNKRDLVTPDQTCALLDLLNELHPEDRPDAE